jgi:hypothetical protein
MFTVLHALGIGRMSPCYRFVSSVSDLAKTVRWCCCRAANASDQTLQPGQFPL